MYRIIKTAAAAAAGSPWSACTCQRGQEGVRNLGKVFQSLQPPSLILFLKYKIILPLLSAVVRAGYGPITHGGDLVQQVLPGPSLIPG